MITLYIDTSDKDVSIAIIKDSNILSEIQKEIPNEHSIYTVPFINESLNKCNLKPNDIDNIMVVNGPGSFTGIRIGVTIAKVYAYLLHKEIRTVSSLKALAISTDNNYILSLIDAKHNNYYLGLYDQNYNEVMKEGFYNLDTVNELLNKYNPKVVTNSNIKINNNTYYKQKINIPKVVSYYLQEKPIISHLVVPNYLKLPQAMEQRHD